MKIKNLIRLSLFASVTLLAASCSKDKNKHVAPKKGIDTILVKAMDIGFVKFNGRGFDTDTTNHYVLFRFSDNKVIPLEDSATTKWDIGFYFPYFFNNNDIILNSGIHGPGKAEGQILNEGINNIPEAPQQGYKMDDKASGNVFGSFNSYDYQTHLVIPDSTKTYVIHTNDNKYVKMTVLNYYQGAPSENDLDFQTSVLGYLTFKYIIQQDGSRSFNKE